MVSFMVYHRIWGNIVALMPKSPEQTKHGSKIIDLYSSLLSTVCLACLMLYRTIINNQALNKIKLWLEFYHERDVYISMTNV